MRSLGKVAVAVAVALVLSGGSALAQVNPGVAEDTWGFSFGPTFWFAGMDGKFVTRGSEGKIDVGFSDLWEVTEIALNPHFEATKGPWSILAEVLYMKLEDRSYPGGTQVDTEIEFLILELGAAYRVYGDRDVGGMMLEAMGGGRYWHIEGEIEAPGAAIDVSSSEDWVDPFVGGRFGWYPEDWLSVTVRADVGGFDVGSDFAWDARTAVGFKLTKRGWLSVGYRLIDIDYDNAKSGTSKTAFDMQIDGPFVSWTTAL
ncbi:MAG: hypothetical protein ACYTAN_05440 [Planctomycetota bacterium]|jgi:hypothetical protein